ncbi:MULTISPECIES: hypothetical protein [Thermocrispum]|uniref:Uncharacterized protein n=1 Tax=Thermocrispum agreste TaxID=37925 RepID=A0A2W4LGW3_9PSEU|nr:MULTISPECIES: hypothetical protein [Thermocrispum]PZN00350.1 MAG: hypothetical protein DIU77_03875 [Thermocrispum agreste]
MLLEIDIVVTEAVLRQEPVPDTARREGEPYCRVERRPGAPFHRSIDEPGDARLRDRPSGQGPLFRLRLMAIDPVTRRRARSRVKSTSSAPIDPVIRGQARSRVKQHVVGGLDRL